MDQNGRVHGKVLAEEDAALAYLIVEYAYDHGEGTLARHHNHDVD